MADSTELEDLEAGLESPFWKMVSEHWASDWGPQGAMYLGAIQSAMANTDDELQRRNLECVMFAQRVVNDLIQWPSRRLQVLKREIDDAPMTYRERMSALRAQDQQAPRGMGRRGRL